MVVEFVLSSHIDPVADRNDVQCLLIFVNVLRKFGIWGTVRTYDTAYVMSKTEYGPVIDYLIQSILIIMNLENMSPYMLNSQYYL